MNKKLTPLQVIEYIYQYTVSTINLKNDKTIIHNITEINNKRKVIFKSKLYESMITNQITSTINEDYIMSYDFFINLYNYYYLLFIYKQNKIYIGYTKVDVYGILPALLVPFKENDRKIIQMFLKYIEPNSNRKKRLKQEIKNYIDILYDYFKINKLLIDLME